MKKIRTVDAVGCVLCHDITQIIPGEFKGRAFKKGHIIKEEDIQRLLSCGKDNIYVWEQTEGIVHENDAAERLRNLSAGSGLTFGETKEGKIDFYAEYDGLLKINKDLLFKVNALGEIMMATVHNNTPVKKGEKVAGTRIIPLVIEDEKLKKAEEIASGQSIVEIISFKSKKIGIVTTGNEVYHGRIKDAFGPVIRKKVEEYDCEVLGQVIVDDNENRIKEAIEQWITKGADIVICTGGMSVDPDDLTPTAIKSTGAELCTYGAPILPGAMLLVAYKGDIPILGLPGCVMYSKRTAFDLVLPRVLIDEKLTMEDIAAYGHGGLCLDCEICSFPHCNFGKGV